MTCALGILRDQFRLNMYIVSVTRAWRKGQLRISQGRVLDRRTTARISTWGIYIHTYLPNAGGYSTRISSRSDFYRPGADCGKIRAENEAFQWVDGTETPPRLSISITGPAGPSSRVCRPSKEEKKKEPSREPDSGSSLKEGIAAGAARLGNWDSELYFQGVFIWFFFFFLFFQSPWRGGDGVETLISELTRAVLLPTVKMINRFQVPCFMANNMSQEWNVCVRRITQLYPVPIELG